MMTRRFWIDRPLKSIQNVLMEFIDKEIKHLITLAYDAKKSIESLNALLVGTREIPDWRRNQIAAEILSLTMIIESIYLLAREKKSIKNPSLK